MSGPMRVPMQNRKGASWITADDIAATIGASPKVGRRFSMDVAEDALAQMGREAIPFVVEKLAHRIVFDHYRDIQSAVDHYLLDHSWAGPIIEDEVRKSVRAYILSMMHLIYETPAAPTNSTEPEAHDHE